jgi:hypothetical protein
MIGTLCAVRRLVLVLLCAAAVGSGATPADACACGVALEASVTRERALVISHEGSEEIVASFDLATDEGGRAAVVLPVPGDPEVEAIEAGDPLSYLDQATLPPPDEEEDDTARPPTAGAGAGGVDVIGREQVGGYDVTRLKAGDPAALDTWLADNGYAMPAGAKSIFADYVKEGWRYVAIRLADDSSGRLKPLRVSFPTDELVYPMRLTQLGTQPVDLTLYVLGDGPARVDDLDISYEGAVADLEPAPPTEIAGLFEGQLQLTKLTATGADPAAFTSDLAIRSLTATTGAVSDDDDGVDWWVYALIAFAVVDSLVLFGFMRRRRST